MTVKFGSSRATVVESTATTIKAIVGPAPDLLAGSYELHISPSKVGSEGHTARGSCLALASGSLPPSLDMQCHVHVPASSARPLRRD